MVERLSTMETFKENIPGVRLQELANVASSTWHKHLMTTKGQEFCESVNGSSVMECSSGEGAEGPRRGRPKTESSINIHGEDVPNPEIVALVRGIKAEEFFVNGGGYRKMSHYLLRRYGVRINHKKLYWLLKESQLLLPRRRRVKGQSRAIAQAPRIITEPFKLWELDIKYGRLVTGEFFYVMAIIDVYLRYVVGFHVGLRCRGQDLKRTLLIALERFQINPRNGLHIRSDNGPQMRSIDFMRAVASNSSKLAQEFIPFGESNKNAHIESFNSILEVEFFSTKIFQDFGSAYAETNKFIKFYNEERIHGSLRYRTPKECLEIILNKGGLNLKPIKV